MDSSVVVGLIVAALTLWIGGGVIFAVVTGKFKEGYQRGYDSVMQPHIARRIAAGEKPWGKPFAGSTYGGAYFMSTQQLLARKLATPIDTLRTDLPYLGGHVTETSEGTVLANLHFPQEGHLITVAPPRAGKGVSHIIPNLLMYKGSTIVIDIKGQNDAITGRWREDNVNETLAFQPFNPNGTASFNPFDFIRTGSDAWDDAQLIAEMLVPPGRQADEFWDNEARNMVAITILHVLDHKDETKRNLTEVRRILTLGEAAFLDVIGEMQHSKREAVLRMADHYLSMEEKVKANVRTTARNKTYFLDSAYLTRAMSHSDWCFEDLKCKPMSIYIVIPPDRLSTYFPLLRLMVGLATAALGRKRTRPKVPILFILDEFPQLGRMDRLVDAMRWIAEYGVRYWIFIQDIPSLQSIYSPTGAASIMANCGCRIFFGTADYATAQEVSDMTGKMQVMHENRSISKAGLFKTSESVGMQYGTQPLLAPEEVLQLDRDLQLVFIQGERPIMAVKTPYYKDPFFGPRAADALFEEV